MAQTVILLHGFAGTGHLWGPVVDRLGAERYRALAPDLRGHGAAHANRPADTEGMVADVLELAGDERCVLVGYSMGGRLALHVALAAPRRFARVIVVSATAGIEDAAQRAARVASDEELASFAETHDIDAFAERWMAVPLFAGEPPEARRRWRDNVLENTPSGLAASLRGFGAGTMPAVWDRLAELMMPITVLAGERDERYAEIGRRLVATLPDAELVIVSGAGHGLPRERPDAIADAIAPAQPR